MGDGGPGCLFAVEALALVAQDDGSGLKPGFFWKRTISGPINAEFIAEAMRQLPDQALMGAILKAVYAGDDASGIAVERFRDSLNRTMVKNEPDE